MKNFAGILVLAIALSGCHSSEDVAPKIWYDVYGNVCGSSPKPGCNYYSDGKKISYMQDPYFSSAWTVVNTHWSLNCEYSTDPLCNQYQMYYSVNPQTYYSNFRYFDGYGNAHSYTGMGWLSQSGIFYDQAGNALNAPDSESEMDRDVIAVVAVEEQRTLQEAGRDFAQRYALAEDVGVRIARVVNDWSRIGMKRARTEADIRDFTTRLYGVDFNKVAVSLERAKKGDRAEFAEVLQDMAHAWGTTPETAHVILVNSYGSLLREYNLE